MRVNVHESWGFLRRRGPLALIALAIAGAQYLNGPGLSSGRRASFSSAAVCLFFTTILWVVLWDPIEQLTFDSIVLRTRARVLRRLGDATVRFQYAGPAERAST